MPSLVCFELIIKGRKRYLVRLYRCFGACYMSATASTGWHWNSCHAQPLTWPSSTPTTRGQRPACWTSLQQNIAVISCQQKCGSTDWEQICWQTGCKTNCWLVPNIGGSGANRENHRSVYKSVPSRLQNRKEMRLQWRISLHLQFLFCSWLVVLEWFAVFWRQIQVNSACHFLCWNPVTEMNTADPQRSLFTARQSDINPLKTQFVPRSKHFSSRL